MTRTKIVQGGRAYLATKVAAKRVGLVPDYVARLARKGLVDGVFVDGVWYVNQDSLSGFIIRQEQRKQEFARRTSLERRTLLGRTPDRSRIRNMFPTRHVLLPVTAVAATCAMLFLATSYSGITLMPASANAAGIGASLTHLAGSIHNALCPLFGSCDVPQEPVTEIVRDEHPDAGQRVPFASVAPSPEADTSAHARDMSSPQERGATYITQPIVERIIERPVSTVDAVTHGDLTVALGSLGQALRIEFGDALSRRESGPLFPFQIAAGGNSTGYQAALIAASQSAPASTPASSAGPVAASSVTGTITNAIDSTLATIASLSGDDLAYSRASFDEATSTILHAGSLSLGSDCSAYGNGGKLTTDAAGNVVCSADQGGAGGTVGGSTGQVQYNDYGVFGGSASFAYSTSSQRLSVTNASTTNLSASYASSTRAAFGSATTSSLAITNLADTLLYANGTGSIVSVATSSLGLPTFSDLGSYLSLASWYATTTDALAEGSNLYFTTARATTSFIGNLAATTSVASITTLPNLSLPYSQLTGAPTSLASSTLLSDSNSFSSLQTFANASSTLLSSSYASSTSGYFGSLSLGSLEGPLQAVNGSVSATSTLSIRYGGTGLSGTPSYGQLLLGQADGTYALVATSSLGITSGGGPSASSTLLSDSNYFSGTNTFANTIQGSVSGNAGTVTNGVYTTTFNGLFDSRFVTDLAATSSVASITTLANLVLPATQLSGFGVPFYSFFHSTTTDALAEGSTHRYYSSALFAADLAATTSVSSIVTLNNLVLPASQVSGFASAATANFVSNLAATTSVASITTLPNLSLPSSQVTGLFAYLFPNNATTTELAFSGGLTASRATTTNATTSSLAITGISGSLLKTGATGSVIPAVAGTDYQPAGTYVTSVSGSWPLVSSGGTTPTISWNGLSTTSNFTTGQLVYASGVGSLTSVATSAPTIGSSLSYSGTFGNLVGGAAGTLSLNLGNANTWTALQTFNYSSSTIYSSFATASSTNLFAGSATTSNLSITGIASGNILKTTTGGYLTAAVAGTDYANFAYLFPNNATTTALGLYASTTIGNGTATGGLTVSGGATTTGNAYFAGSVGIGTVTPGFPLEIKQAGAVTLMLDSGAGSNASMIRLRNGGTSKWAFGNFGTDSSFRINTGTGIGTNDPFVLQSTGNVGIGTTSPWAKLSVFAGGDYASQAASTLFAIGSTTAGTATSTLFSVNSTGSTTLFRIPSSVLKTDSSGTIVAAVAGTDYQAPLSATWPITFSANTIGWNGLSTTSNFTTGNIIYASGSGSLTSAATSTPSIGSVLTYSGTLGNLIGGTSGTFSIANSAVTNAMLANSSLTVNGTSISLGASQTITAASSTLLSDSNYFSGKNVFANATTTLLTAPTAWITKLANLASAGFVKTAADGTLSVDTSTYLTSAVTSASQTYGSAQTGAITFATSSAATSNGVTVSSTITNSGGTFTWNPVVSVANIPNAALANSTISGIALGGSLNALTAGNTSLTFSGSYDGSTARTVSLNMGNANTWTALQTFNYSSSTIYSSFATASSTNLFAGSATTSNLSITGISSGNILKTTTGGYLTAAVAGTDYANFAYPFPSAATSTFLTLSGGLSTTYASTTQIGSTGNAYFATSGGNVGIGTTTPQNILAVAGSASVMGGTLGVGSFSGSEGGQLVLGWNNAFPTGQVNRTWNIDVDASDNFRVFRQDASAATRVGFSIASSTGTVTTTYASTTVATISGNAYFPGSGIWNSSGNVGIGTTSPGSLLSIGGTGTGWNFFDNATTTSYAKGIDLKNGGCFAVNGTCISGGGGGSGTVSSGTQGQFAFYNANGTTVSGTSTIFVSQTSLLGVGSSTPWAKLSVDTSNLLAGVPSFSVGSSTRQDFVITQGGNVGIGTTTPSALLTISGGVVAITGPSGTGKYSPVNITPYDSTGSNNIQLRKDASGNPAAAIGMSMPGLAVGDDMVFSTLNSGSGWSERMRIANTSGDVGIGTSTPWQLLSVNGTVAANAILPNGPYTTNLSAYDLGATGQRWNALWAGALNIGTSTFSLKSNAASGLGFYTAASGGGTEAMTITTAGNVGIGTTTPSYQLHAYSGTDAARVAVFDVTGTHDSSGTGMAGFTINNRSTSASALAGITFSATDLTGVGRHMGSIAFGKETGWTGAGDYPGFLSFYTRPTGGEDTERLRITSAGNVGVGTTSPATTFSIAGNSYLTGGLGIGGVNTTANTLKLFGTTASSTSNEILFSDNGQIRSSDNNHRIVFDRTNNTMDLVEYGDINISAGATSGIRNSSLVVKGSGNVGIGTNNPGSILEVQTGSNRKISFATLGTLNNVSDDSSYDSMINFSRSSDGVTNVGGLGLYNGTNLFMGAYGDLVFGSGAASTFNNAYERMRITSAGNVGIGSTSPSNLLSLRKTTAATVVDLLSLSNESTQGSGSRILFNGTYGAQSAIKSLVSPGDGSFDNEGDMVFQTAVDSTLFDRVTIKYNGNVGIGTTTPNQALSVVGRIMTTGSSYTTNPQGPIFGQYDSTTGYAQAPAGGKFQIWDDATAAIATFADNGNVGIGSAITSPSYKLEVGGTLASTIMYDKDSASYYIDPNATSNLNSVTVNGTLAWGTGRTETRDNAGLQGDSGAVSGFFQTASPTNYPSGASSWWHLLDVRHSNTANNYAMQIAGSFFDQDLYFRKTNNSASQAWSKFVVVNTSGDVNLPGSGIWNSSGSVGIGKSPSYTLDVNGNVNSTGYRVSGTAGVTGQFNVDSTCSTPANAYVNFSGGIATGFTDGAIPIWCDGDIAENYGTTGTYPLRGEIVAMTNETASRSFTVGVPSPGESTTTPYTITTAKVKLATAADRSMIMGGVPTAPKMLGDDVIAPEDHPQAVALVGHIPIRMTLDGGDVAVGDPITVSTSTPGAGMKALTSGRIVGWALEAFTATATSSDGMIEVYVKPQDWIAPDDFDSLLALTQSLAGTGPASPAPSDSFIGRLFSALAANIRAWLSDAGNGIADFFANRVHTKELCVSKADGTEVCVTGDQLAALVAAASTSGTSQSSPPPDPASSPATLALNGDASVEWELNAPWQDNLGALFTHDGISETIYSTSTVDTAIAGTTTIDYWATWYSDPAATSSGQTLHTTREVVVMGTPLMPGEQASSTGQ